MEVVWWLHIQSGSPMLVYASAKLRLPEDGAEALKRVGVFIKYFNIFFLLFILTNAQTSYQHTRYTNTGLQILYAPTKQLSHFINIDRFYHTTIHCFY
jgi:hypothetical protein